MTLTFDINFISKVMTFDFLRNFKTHAHPCSKSDDDNDQATSRHGPVDSSQSRLIANSTSIGPTGNGHADKRQLPSHLAKSPPPDKLSEELACAGCR